MTSTSTSVKLMVLWLIDRVDSDFVREGTENSAHPDVLNSPGDYRLPSDSYMIVKEKGVPVQRPIRYIAGCPMIIVEEQEKAGIKPDAINDVIWFKNGKLVVADSPEDKGLYNYLSKCAWNKDNPDRPDRVKPIFFVEDKVADAEKSLLLRNARNQAIDLVQSLTEIKGKEIKYNKEKIDFLCNLFNVSTGFEYAEKVNMLLDIAEVDPGRFIESVANTTNEYRAAINEAVSLEVISLDGEKASFMNSRKAFLTLITKDRNDRVDELVSFMLSTEEGGMTYKEMVIEVDSARRKKALNN